MSGGLVGSGFVTGYASAATESLIPAPNLPGQTLNYIGRSPTVSDDDRWDTKIDHILTNRQRFSIAYTWAEFVRDGWGPFPVEQKYLSGFTTRDQWNQVIRASHDFTISPTVLNHFSFGFNRDWVFNGSSSIGQGWGNKLGLKGVADPNGIFPHIRFLGSAESSHEGLASAAGIAAAAAPAELIAAVG